MGRKSTVEMLPLEVRTFFQKLLRENQLTIDGMFQSVYEKFPEHCPSRSAIARSSKKFKEAAEEISKIESISSAMVAEMGENPNDKTGALLVQAVTTIATKAAMGKLNKEGEDLATKEILELARATKYAQESRVLSRKERLAIEQDARERLLREQEANLEKTAKAQGMSAEQVDFWRREVLGVG